MPDGYSLILYIIIVPTHRNKLHSKDNIGKTLPNTY